MSMMNFFVLTSAQKTSAIAFNNSNVAVAPRAVDNSSPGVGINLNDAASGVAAGESVTLTGKHVVPKRLVDDTQYQVYAPNMITFLLTLPFCSLETETIFAPIIDD